MHICQMMQIGILVAAFIVPCVVTGLRHACNFVRHVKTAISLQHSLLLLVVATTAVIDDCALIEDTNHLAWHLAGLSPA